MTIDICIATYKRPALLRKLLESLRNQAKGNRIIIVDNDKAGSAREVAEGFTAQSGIPTVYDIEPEQNIALARNRAISHAQGDYIAFIDDDETVSEYWLANLAEAARKFEADIVFGPSLPVYPSMTPQWVIDIGCFEVSRQPTGTPVPHGSTSNVLIRRQSLINSGLGLFDPAYGLTGGEDVEFFHRLGKAGLKLIWSDEAIAHEEIHANRVSLNWLLKRSYRGGQSVARIFLKHKKFDDKLLWFIQRIFILGSVVLLPVLWVFSREKGLRLLVKISGSLGQLTGHTNFIFREYQH